MPVRSSIQHLKKRTSFFSVVLVIGAIDSSPQSMQVAAEILSIVIVINHSNRRKVLAVHDIIFNVGTKMELKTSLMASGANTVASPDLDEFPEPPDLKLFQGHRVINQMLNLPKLNRNCALTHH